MFNDLLDDLTLHRLPQIKKPSPHFFIGEHYINLNEVVMVRRAYDNTYQVFLKNGQNREWGETNGKAIVSGLKSYHEAHESPT